MQTVLPNVHNKKSSLVPTVEEVCVTPPKNLAERPKEKS